MDVKLSVIIPSVGRASLAEALSSCADADEIVVVADEANDPVSLPVLPPNAVLCFVRGGDHGYTARTRGMEVATGTHLAFLDDDDIYTPDAISLLKQHACDRPVVFRMDHYRHGILWREPVLEFGNVSTQMFVVPNVPEKLGVWAPHMPGLAEPGGDYTFLAGCAANMGDPVWREELVAILRPDFPAVTVVTPWHDHPELADDYLAAVRCLGPRDRVVVIDNASTHDLSTLEQGAANITVIRNDENAGFMAASNQGLEAADTPCVLFLNNDIRHTAPDWLERLRGQMAEGSLVGACLRYDRHADVDGINLPYLDGWCLGGMTADLRDLGGFDETLELPGYFSDNLLCLRARAAGMTLREVQTGLAHLCGITSRAGRGADVSDSTRTNYNRYADEARELLVAA